MVSCDVFQASCSSSAEKFMKAVSSVHLSNNTAGWMVDLSLGFQCKTILKLEGAGNVPSAGDLLLGHFKRA